MSYDAILLDFDGVLADTEPIHFACWKQVLEPYNIDLNWPFYQKHCIGVSDRLMIHALAPGRFEEVWPSYDIKRTLFQQRLESEPPFLEATVECIRSISEIFKLAVVSSSGRSEVEPPLERAGLRSYFQTLVCGREVPNLKPAPDPYLRAAELLGSTRPLVVEDSDAGVASATAAGFDVLRVSSPHQMPSQLHDHLISVRQRS